MVRRRLTLFAIAALVIAGWGPKAAIVLVDGWVKPVQVKKREREIKAARQNVDALKRELDYLRTPEGKDVEAKRQFGVGPKDEIWITVEAQCLEPVESGPGSIAEQINGWLSNVGDRSIDRVRETGEVVRYLIGADDVSVHARTVEIDASGDEAPPPDGDADAQDSNIDET
jgi:hypothetical protein